jgi:hemerythrin superfamily protein
MDAELLERLEAEHRQVEELFARLEKAETESQQRPLVDQLVASLTQHMEVEERDVYPEVYKIDSEMEEEAEIEHRLGREGMATLQEMIGQPGFGAAVAMLQAGISHHVEEEEGEVFPKLREAMGFPPADASKRDLYEQARAAGIEGRSSMTKDELAAALQRA